MTGRARLALAELARSPGRTLLRIVVLAIAVSLLGSMLVFVSGSLRTMTQSAVRTVPLDWQGPVPSYAAANAVAQGVARQQDVTTAQAVATAPFASTAFVSSVGQIQTGAGAILAVPPGYADRIKTFRYLHGGLAADGVVLDQQLAATLQAGVGDTITLIPRVGVQPVRLRVTGVAVVTAPDAIFQPLNPLAGPAPSRPPANILIMPIAQFAAKVAPALPAIAATTGQNAVPGAQTGTQWQVQAQLDPHALSGDPSHALAQATQVRNRVERSLPGQVQFVDNLGDSLTTAAGDALYAQTLYIMLAVPGALIALGLAYLAALGTAESDRRQAALMRARGATRSRLVVTSLIESLVLGVIGGVLGALAAFGTVALLVKGGVQVTGTRAGVTVVACIALAVAGAAAARLGASASVLRSSIVDARRSSRRTGTPLWQRLWLDVACLAVSGLVYWLTSRTGFSAVVNPDSNPTLSLSVYMFAAPAFLWIGATLLLVRLRGRALAWAIRRAAGGRATTLPGFVLASAGRRGAAINRGLIIVGLLLAFGVELGIFTATYQQQARVDAQLTLGANVAVDAPAGAIAAHRLDEIVSRTPGVTATTAVNHSYAYVGPDLQDTFGIDPARFAKATSLRDSYFIGGGATEMMHRLATTPDGILVSKETITDYQLKRGDQLRLRVLDQRSGKFRIAPFRVVGVVQEFPSAPKDSFMVANASYLQRVTGNAGPNVIFADTSGNASAVGRRISGATSRFGTTVANIDDQLRTTTSSITTVDLTGISRIEQLFAVILAAAAMGLFVALGVAERRHEFATMAAVGSSRRDIGAFVWSEAAVVLGAGALLAAGLGWLLSEMLIAMLQHVFDPPPDRIAVPWLFLALLGGAALAGGVVATAVSAQRLRRLPLGAILREE